MKNKLFILVLLSFSSALIFAQSGKQLLSMDNYLVPINKKGATVGKVITRPGEKVTLKDPNKLFTLDKKGVLSLKKNKSITNDSPQHFEVMLESNLGETKSFDLVKDDFIRNKVVAHRGAWKNQDASQNSIKSLEKAIEIGCESSEFDVWLSSDNLLVISHDPSIEGKKVEESTADELFKIPLKDGDFVPSVEDYLNVIKSQNKTRLVLEVKASLKGKQRSEEVAEASVRKVHELQAQAWVDYITFDFDAALRIRELDPTAKILYLEANKSLEELRDARISGIDYHYSHFKKDKELQNEAKTMGLLTNVWTVNSEEDLNYFYDLGLDYITTDQPELLLKITSKK